MSVERKCKSNAMRDSSNSSYRTRTPQFEQITVLWFELGDTLNWCIHPLWLLYFCICILNIMTGDECSQRYAIKTRANRNTR